MYSAPSAPSLASRLMFTWVVATPIAGILAFTLSIAS